MRHREDEEERKVGGGRKSKTNFLPNLFSPLVFSVSLCKILRVSGKQVVEEDFQADAYQGDAAGQFGPAFEA